MYLYMYTHNFRAIAPILFFVLYFFKSHTHYHLQSEAGVDR